MAAFGPAAMEAAMEGVGGLPSTCTFCDQLNSVLQGSAIFQIVIKNFYK